MACVRCKNEEYPAVFKTDQNRKSDGSLVQYCKVCDYPRVSQKVRERILGKVDKVKHLAFLPKGSVMKKVDPKYFGETLDPQHRPLEDLNELKKKWLEEWDKNSEEAPNFYDWVGTIKGNARVLQLTAEERVPYAVTIKDNCLHGNFVEKKYSDYAFVLDGEGNFYSAPKQTSGETRIHHSTFLGGAPVQCAGVFFCPKQMGEHAKEISFVKDYSGHYQPGIKEILRLKRRLKDLKENNVVLWYYGTAAVPQYKGLLQNFTGHGATFTEPPPKPFWVFTKPAAPPGDAADATGKSPK